jgi:hypothetical protein
MLGIGCQSGSMMAQDQPIDPSDFERKRQTDCLAEYQLLDDFEGSGIATQHQGKGRCVRRIKEVSVA